MKQLEPDSGVEKWDYLTNPMSRAPTPEPTPLIDPNSDPTPTLDSYPALSQNHTHPHSSPGPEPLTLSATLDPRTYLDSACSGVSVASRAGPKDKGDRAPMSEQARQARRNKERNKRRLKRQELSASRREDKDPGQLADAKSKLVDVAESQPVCSGKPTYKNKNNNNNPSTNPPTNTPTNPTSLRSPDEVYSEVNPRFTVTVSRPGAGEDAIGQIIRTLLFVPEDYSVGRITQVTDGVTFGVEEDNSLRVVREVLEADGWGLTITPVWNRYWLYVPNQYQNLPLDELILGFNMRNSQRVRGPEGLPENSIRAVGVMEEVIESGQRQRVRALVDISPEGEEYLRANDFLLRIVFSAVRLRPATSIHPVIDRS